MPMAPRTAALIDVRRKYDSLRASIRAALHEGVSPDELVDHLDDPETQTVNAILRKIIIGEVMVGQPMSEIDTGEQPAIDDSGSG